MPTVFPFVIPKNSIKRSLILSGVGIYEAFPTKTPQFQPASWEGVGRWMFEQPPGVQLFGTHIALSNAYWFFWLLEKVRRIFHFNPGSEGGVSLFGSSPFRMGFFACYLLVSTGKVGGGLCPLYSLFGALFK